MPWTMGYAQVNGFSPYLWDGPFIGEKPIYLYVRGAGGRIGALQGIDARGAAWGARYVRDMRRALRPLRPLWP